MQIRLFSSNVIRKDETIITSWSLNEQSTKVPWIFKQQLDLIMYLKLALGILKSEFVWSSVFLINHLQCKIQYVLVFWHIYLMIHPKCNGFLELVIKWFIIYISSLFKCKWHISICYCTENCTRLEMAWFDNLLKFFNSFSR